MYEFFEIGNVLEWLRSEGVPECVFTNEHSPQEWKLLTGCALSTTLVSAPGSAEAYANDEMYECAAHRVLHQCSITNPLRGTPDMCGKAALHLFTVSRFAHQAVLRHQIQLFFICRGYVFARFWPTPFMILPSRLAQYYSTTNLLAHHIHEAV